eukprot:CAMPEP_0184997660 /NCGR_PEP_ID=MMETSP1098-20130426/60188_1 /TAXON_ID=89044 /ORGANISM="Spumella elongata, Strain CCAP 955/1" /LENGTH=390 /DNA_ID=CAMNT_0027524335 /DNA_START=211 /DNA_END=1383 /DNA_ORIENTATION=+
MIPYFNKPSAPAQARSGGHHQTTRATRKRTIHTLPHIPSALSPSPTVISARERNLHASSPLSVRSSQSEPIRYSNGPNRVIEGTQKRPKTPEFTDSLYSHYDTTLPSIKQVPPHTQPAYNSPAMLTLLRLERNSNNQARNQIAKLTGWKAKESEGSSSDKNSSNEPIKASKDIANEAKVEQVNKMKQLYMSGGVDNSGEVKKLHFPPIHGASSNNTITVSKLTLTNLAQHNSGNHTHNTTSATTNKVTTAAPEVLNSGVEHDETVMQTPRVGDVDLDDAAFNLVSKYFQSGTNDSIGIASSSGPYATNGPLNRTVGTDGNRNVAREGNFEGLLVSEGESLDPPLTPALRKDSRTNINLTPHPRTPAQGFEDFGGIDGLLAWSSQLELDII